MKALVHHDPPEALIRASRRSKSGRVAPTDTGDTGHHAGAEPEVGVRAVRGQPGEFKALGSLV
jgi:hypothetical protein